MRVGNAVRADQAVVAEVGVGSVIAVEVAAVGIDHHAVLALPADGLVHEVPDEATLELIILAVEVPVLLEATLGVAHRVGILALDERLGHLRVGRIADDSLVAGVHRAVDVGLAVDRCALVLDRTGEILGLDPVVGSLEVGAVAGFIAQGPDDDGRVVVAALDIALVALHMRKGIVVALGKGPVAITHTVGLDVGLGHHIDAVLVAEVIPVVVIRIVAGTHRIEVELLHDLDVLLHTGAGDYVTSVRIQLVAVGALDEDGLAVDEQLGVLDLDLAETDVHGDRLARGGRLEGIEVRGLGRPLGGIGDLHRHVGLAAA